MNTKQLNRILARAMYGMVIAAMVFSATGSVYAQDGHFSIGYHDYDEGSVPSWNCKAGGWAMDTDSPGENVNIRVLVDGVQIMDDFIANNYREDLETAWNNETGGCPDGKCAFEVNIWDYVSLDQEHQITVQAYDVETADWWNLEGSPKTLTCSPHIEAFAWYDRYSLVDWPADTAVYVTITNPDYVAEPFTPDNPRSWYDFYPEVDLQPGSVITATNGDITKVLTVSTLSGVVENVEKGLVSGVATPGSIFHMRTDGDNFQWPIEQDIDSGLTGSWSITLDQYLPWTWFTRGEMWEGDDDGDVTYAIWHVQQQVIEVWLAQNEIRAFGWPGDTELTINVDGEDIGTASTEPVNWMESTWAVFNAGELQLEPGMEVIVTDGIAPPKSITVRDLMITNIDIDDDIVEGYAPQYANLELGSWKDSPVFRFFNNGEDSNWVIDYKIPSINDVTVDLDSGDELRLFMRDAERDSTVWQSFAPWIPLTFTVNTTDDNDDGTCDENHCSLREAINAANGNPIMDTIVFGIPGEAPFTIQPQSPLPNIDDSVIIDGTSQPGFEGQPIIELDGTYAGEWVTGLVIGANESTVKGLVINRFSDNGIMVFGSGNTIRGNYLGTNVTGTTTTGPEGTPVEMPVVTFTSACPAYPVGTDINGFVSESEDPLAPWSGTPVHFLGTDVGCGSPEMIGAASLIYRYKLEFADVTPLESITVSGAAFNGPDNVLRLLDEDMNVLGQIYTFGGNSFVSPYLGLQGVEGTVFYLDEFDTSSHWRYRESFVINGPIPLGNHGNGVLLAGGATDNQVIDNLISGNMGNGVAIFNPGTTRNVVQENKIGTDITGVQALGNAAPGIGMGDQAYENFIIGNLISGNRSDGIAIFNPGTNGNILQGNHIGTDVNREVALSNAGVGVWIGDGASNTVIGGNDASVRNVISGNKWGGVSINDLGTTGTRVTGNYIGTNKNGDVALPNGGDGVYISGSENVIGGSEPGAGNVISGNMASGVSMAWGATGNLMQNNFVGTDVSGTAALHSASGSEFGTYDLDVLPETCPTYEAGTSRDSFVSQSSDPSAPWAGMSVMFMGTDEDKCGVPDTFEGAPLIYRYKLTFAEETELTSIAVTGAAFGGGALRVLDENRDVLGTSYNFGGNSYQTNYIRLSDVVGQVFFIEEYDYSSDWRYRESIVINGPLPVGNLGSGVNFNNGASNNLVLDNLISGNRSDAVSLYHTGTNGNVLQGNYIGTNVTGTAAVPNTSAAIWIGEGASNTVIGGIEEGQGNLISGNTGDAISINHAETMGTVIQGNFIGTDVTGSAALPNNSNGIVLVTGTHDNLIGGTEPGAGNIIAFNYGIGILYGDAGVGNAALSNSVFSNGGLGIDLGGDYVTRNDPLDQDTGPNNLQNFPIITAVTRMGSEVMIQGLLPSTSLTMFRVELFSNETCDPSGFGEGGIFLGATTAKTNPAGLAHFAITLPISLPQGYFVTATATDPAGNTSEFSRCFTPAPGWNQINDSGFGNPMTIGVTALEVFQDQLYAGAANWEIGGQIWRLGADGLWSQVNDSGFADGANNPAILDLTIFQGQLYAGTGLNNDAPGQVWRSTDGIDWQPVTVDGFGNSENIAVTNFVAYKGMLYAGIGSVDGSAQIWRSPTGNSGSWTQVAPDGSGLAGNVSGFAVFKNALYASIEPADGSGAPIQVWRSTNGSDWVIVTDNGFEDESNMSTGGFAQFGGYLYLGTRNEVTGAQLWRTNDGVHWALVVDNGFGDLNNIKIESLFVYNDLLYAVTYNWAGLQVWRSVDGLNWEWVADNGFGDGSNFSTLWNSATTVYQGQIVIGTWNGNEGGEIWQFTP